MKQTTNVPSGYLCHCLKITAPQFEQILDRTACPSFALLRKRHGVGSVCSACELEAKGVVADYVAMHPECLQRREGLRDRLVRTLQLVRRQLRLATARGAAPRPLKDYQSGIFFLRRAGLETQLALSNLPFPEHAANANGDEIRFRARLHGEDGTALAVSDERVLRSGGTLTLSAAELFPALHGEFTGGLYVEIAQLRQTGSLRTYGILTGPGARCHFHDKFGLRDDPGFFINTAPFPPGETCWLGLANCQPRAYETEAFLDTGRRVLRAPFHVGPLGARWQKLADLFPELEVPPEGLPAAHFWLENPQHVMLYFFWQHAATGSWIAQHH